MIICKGLLLPPPAAAVTPGAPALIVAGTGASGTAPRVTTTGAASAGQLVICAIKSSASAATSFSDTAGNTWSVNTSAGTGTGRLQIARSVLTNPISIGDSVGPNYGVASAADLVMAVFPAATAFDDIATSGTSATNANPSITLTSLDSATEIAAFAIFSNGSLDDIDSASGWPAGYVSIGSVEAGGFGTRLYWKTVTGTPTYSAVFTPTGAVSALWTLQGISMSA